MSQKGNESTIIYAEGKYGILMEGRNWIVSSYKAGSVQAGVRNEDFDTNSYTYHANIRQAIIEMSRRMLKDSLSKACHTKTLQLHELAEIIKANDQWMRKKIMGRGE